MTEFTSTKPALASTGVWGSLTAIAGVLLPVILKALKVDDVIASQDVINVAGQVIAGVGGLIALYGRLTAKHKLT